MERLTNEYKACADCGNAAHCRMDCFHKQIYEKLKHYEDMEEQGRLVVLPCKVGDTVYRICPKCNDKHDGSCENCAWRSSMTNCGCTTYGLWGDGQYPPDECTIVPYKVFWNYIPNMIEKFGKTVFLTREDAERALKGGAVE